MSEADCQMPTAREYAGFIQRYRLSSPGIYIRYRKFSIPLRHRREYRCVEPEEEIR